MPAHFGKWMEESLNALGISIPEARSYGGPPAGTLYRWKELDTVPSEGRNRRQPANWRKLAVCLKMDVPTLNRAWAERWTPGQVVAHADSRQVGTAGESRIESPDAAGGPTGPAHSEGKAMNDVEMMTEHDRLMVALNRLVVRQDDRIRELERKVQSLLGGREKQPQKK